MRYYLDTNILVSIVRGEGVGELTRDVSSLLSDSENMMYTSTVCVQELIHIIQIGKLRRKKNDNVYRMALEAYDQIVCRDIRIQPLTTYHFRAYAALPMVGDHRDPFDRLIIAQAIADRITLISSDVRFEAYRPHGLDFIYNER